MAGRGPFVLVAALLLVAAGPLLAEFLPPGPSSLVDPAGAAIGAAAIAVLWALFVWPVLSRDRSRLAVLGEGALIFLLSAPFVVGLAHSHGARWPAILAALAMVAGAVAVAGIWRAGHDSRRDRWFVAFWLAVVAAIPLANWVLMDFAGLRGTLGFRISPVLAVRRILLELPGADPVPFLVTALAFAAASSATSMLRRGAAAAVLLVLAGGASAAELVPVLGDRYVHGRLIPIRLTNVEGRVTVRLPGQWTTEAEEGELVFLPGAEGLRSVEVDGEMVAVDLLPVPAGRLLVSLDAVPRELSQAADAAGFVIRRAAPGVERRLYWRHFGSVDGVIDPTGLLGDTMERNLRDIGVAVVRRSEDLPGETPLRRPWQEEGRVLSSEGLDRMFPPGQGPDASRARSVFLVLLLYSTVVAALVRFGRRRRRSAVVSATGVVLLTLVSVFLVGAVVRPLPDWEVAKVHAITEGRWLTVQRVRATRATQAALETSPVTIVLGRGSEVEGGAGIARFALAAGESRLLVSESPGRVENGPFDFFLTPEGLAKPGEAALPAGEFLRRHLPGPNGWLVRKLLRLDGSLKHTYGVRIPAPGRLEVLRVMD